MGRPDEGHWAAQRSRRRGRGHLRLRKWSRLALQGNPTVLLPLYVAPDHVLIQTSLGAELPEVVRQAAANFDPSRITEYLFELCKVFAFIFTDRTNHPIATCADEELRRGRLLLVEAVGNVLRAGLRLLGITPLEEM